MHKHRLKIDGLICIFLAGFLFWCLSIHASEVANTSDISSVIQTTQVHQPLPGIAQDWGLTEVEWQNYLKLMQGPDGLWYSQLHPAAVLGMNATTEPERRHYAEIIARQEHDKVARELIFNHAVYLAMRKEYADEPIIQPFDKSPFNPSHSRSVP